MPQRLTKSKFWDKVDILGPDDCWVWKGSRDDKGYGQVGVNGKVYKAHRVSWYLKNGKIPKGVCILHKCDNPPCCNYNHLFSGTKKDNAVDMAQKGRTSTRRGEDHPLCKLYETDIVCIRQKFREGRSKKSLSREYRVTPTTIRKVISKKIWAHI